MVNPLSQSVSTKTKTVPVLITWDVDPDLWIPFEKRQWALQTAMNLCHGFNIPATFFITAEPAHLLAREVDTMQTQGHEIGCHGLTHGHEEDYDAMPEATQQTYIQQATTKLQALTGRQIHSFRGPRVKTSAITHKLLVEHGYLADSSVCSQRLDLISSNLINPGWIFSPRRAYHPHPNNPFKQGDTSLWEIPVSAAVIPFISSALRVLGLPALKTLFKVLYTEASYTGKPIVYLAHPTEFGRGSREKKKTSFQQQFAHYLKPEYFSPTFIRTHGLRMRNLLYTMDGATLLERTQELFSYMSTFTNVNFMTISQYVASLDKIPDEQKSCGQS